MSDHDTNEKGEKLIDQLMATVRRALELGADAVLVMIREPRVPILMGLRYHGEIHVGCYAEGRDQITQAMLALGHGYRVADINGALRYLGAFQADVATDGLHLRIACVRKSKPGAAPWNPDMSFPPEPVPNVLV